MQDAPGCVQEGEQGGSVLLVKRRPPFGRKAAGRGKMLSLRAGPCGILGHIDGIARAAP